MRAQVWCQFRSEAESERSERHTPPPRDLDLWRYSDTVHNLSRFGGTKRLIDPETSVAEAMLERLPLGQPLHQAIDEAHAEAPPAFDVE